MSRIFYFCPDFPQPSGGIKTLYRHVQCLVAMGFDAWIVHQRRPFQTTWHGYEVPVRWLSDRPKFTQEDVLVIPEVMQQLMQQTANFAGQRIVIALSWSPTYWNLQPGHTWRHFGITRVMTKSPRIQHYLHWCMGIQATLISEYVDRERYQFSPEVKYPKICYLTRKERAAAWLHGVLVAKGTPFTGFDWTPLRALSEDEYARNLGEATVYLTTNLQEGMNTSVLEAMACGCLVVGYSGIGGDVYMQHQGPQQNCILVENGDLPALGQQLETVLRQLAATPDAYGWIIDNGLATARAYQNPEDEAESLRAIFAPQNRREA